MSRSNKDHSVFLFYLILFGIGFSVYFGMYKLNNTVGTTEFSSHLDSANGSFQQNNGQAPSEKEELKRINNHLFLQAQKQELERMKQNIQNHKTAPDIHLQRDSERQLLTGKGVQFDVDLRQKKMQRDTGRPEKPIEIKELHQVVLAEVARKNLQIKKSEIVQDNYAESYIRYAREQGYDVKLQRMGDHYIVESIMPLRVPNSDHIKNEMDDTNDEPEDQGAQ